MRFRSCSRVALSQWSRNFVCSPLYSIASLVSAVEHAGGVLDVLVNNAGMAYKGSTFGADEARTTIDCNLHGEPPEQTSSAVMLLLSRTLDFPVYAMSPVIGSSNGGEMLPRGTKQAHTTLPLRCFRTFVEARTLASSTCAAKLDG